VDVGRAFPAGDVNNDGYEDVLLLGRSTVKNSLDPGNGFKIYGGSEKLVGVSPLAAISGTMDFAIYPNPLASTENRFCLDLTSNGQQDGHLEIIDLLGRTLYQARISGTDGLHTIDLFPQSLSPGQYLIRIVTSVSAASRVLIVE
jgi:hypothetical protein